jgi:hypothetical protein
MNTQSTKQQQCDTACASQEANRSLSYNSNPLLQSESKGTNLNRLSKGSRYLVVVKDSVHGYSAVMAVDLRSGESWTRSCHSGPSGRVEANEVAIRYRVWLSGRNGNGSERKAWNIE